MKNFPLITALFISSMMFNSCNKEISEPEHKADGSNVVYLKIDDKEEFLLKEGNRRIKRKNTAAFNDESNISYSEYKSNNITFSDFSLSFRPFNYKKSEFQTATIRLRIDKQTQVLDTAFLRNNLKKTWSSAINFSVNSDEFKEYFIDSILDYKIIKWDQGNQILTFSANCTYSRSPKTTPQNPKIYFYFDIKYYL